jgi:nitrogen fixation/metabolism regulation signal transduction histidine kinase
LPRIFEPYVTTKARGTGLGLPIVKKIIEEHLGTIEISNAPEGGARIDIRLPLVKAEEAKNGNYSGR